MEPPSLTVTRASILLNVAHQFITRAAGAAIEDRENRAQRAPVLGAVVLALCVMTTFAKDEAAAPCAARRAVHKAASSAS